MNGMRRGKKEESEEGEREEVEEGEGDADGKAKCPVSFITT